MKKFFSHGVVTGIAVLAISFVCSNAYAPPMGRPAPFRGEPYRPPVEPYRPPVEPYRPPVEPYRPHTDPAWLRPKPSPWNGTGLPRGLYTDPGIRKPFAEYAKPDRLVDAEPRVDANGFESGLSKQRAARVNRVFREIIDSFPSKDPVTETQAADAVEKAGQLARQRLVDEEVRSAVKEHIVLSSRLPKSEQHRQPLLPKMPDAPPEIPKTTDSVVIEAAPSGGLIMRRAANTASVDLVVHQTTKEIDVGVRRRDRQKAFDLERLLVTSQDDAAIVGKHPDVISMHYVDGKRLVQFRGSGQWTQYAPKADGKGFDIAFKSADQVQQELAAGGHVRLDFPNTPGERFRLTGNIRGPPPTGARPAGFETGSGRLQGFVDGNGIIVAVEDVPETFKNQLADLPSCLTPRDAYAAAEQLRRGEEAPAPTEPRLPPSERAKLFAAMEGPEFAAIAKIAGRSPIAARSEIRNHLAEDLTAAAQLRDDQRPGEALEILEHLGRQYPNEPVIEFHKGLCLLAQGETGGAFPLLAKSAVGSPAGAYRDVCREVNKHLSKPGRSPAESEALIAGATSLPARDLGGKSNAEEAIVTFGGNSVGTQVTFGVSPKSGDASVNDLALGGPTLFIDDAIGWNSRDPAGSIVQPVQESISNDTAFLHRLHGGRSLAVPPDRIVICEDSKSRSYSCEPTTQPALPYAYRPATKITPGSSSVVNVPDCDDDNPDEPSDCGTIIYLLTKRDPKP